MNEFYVIEPLGLFRFTVRGVCFRGPLFRLHFLFFWAQLFGFFVFVVCLVSTFVLLGSCGSFCFCESFLLCFLVSTCFFEGCLGFVFAVLWLE